ncbi:hypothetical protein M422DRAFT_238409 [Sphaerobolus stellatus SS14]|nr:hypothetical protein M422DRAFT_238409 [Sphaerobolus stellatus SS14]
MVHQRPPVANGTVLGNIEADKSHHLTGPFQPPTPSGGMTPASRPSSPSIRFRPIAKLSVKPDGLWSDLKTMRWMRVPASSLKMIIYPIILYANFYFLQRFNLIPAHIQNPVEPFLFISHRVPGSPDSDPRYQKGYFDILFVLYYIIVWSFARQSITLYLLHPLSHLCGVHKPAKVERFGEQGYAVVYFTFTTVLGLIVMRQLPTWWYDTKYFWIDYPHWQMTPLIKAYYLLQSAYWLQQLLVLALRLEKPRKDYSELVIHHIVTLWLIGWSYLINLTYIGNAVFISMDISDIFLALAKLANYMRIPKYQGIIDTVKGPIFVWFMGVWTYFRHWLNLVILYSVWYELDLLPENSKHWSPKDGVWFPDWMRYQVFAPLAMLHLVNLFWYFLIWRIALRALLSDKLEDERSDDEDDGEEDEEVEKVEKRKDLGRANAKLTKRK